MSSPIKSLEKWDEVFFFFFHCIRAEDEISFISLNFLLLCDPAALLLIKKNS